MPPDKVFTRNEAISLMHRERAESFRKTAEHILKHGLSAEDTYKLLLEIADEADAQAMVVDLMDLL